jgi:hypothetical protein
MTPARIRVNVGMILPKLLGAALGAALLLAPAARADVLDPVDGVHVAAQDGVRLWNHVDAGLHYSLVDDAGDVLATTDEQNAPFDVSLGNDTEGRLLAVYSRCDRHVQALRVRHRCADRAAARHQRPVAVAVGRRARVSRAAATSTRAGSASPRA